MWWRWSGAAAVMFVVSVARAQDVNSFAATVQELVTRRVDTVERAITRDALERLYQPPSIRPFWTVLGRGPTRQALASIDVLASANARGLPSNVAEIETLRALAAVAGNSPADAARFDVAMSRSAAELIASLHMGRIDPTSVRFNLPNAHDQVDLAALVAGIASASDVSAAIARAEPAYAGYWALTRVLAKYRALAADSTLRAPRRVRSTVRPGDQYEDVGTLGRWLVALGDLEPRVDSVVADTIARGAQIPLYTGAIVDAVARFQRRHGLDPDGAIGPATMSALRVPLAQRVRQIELTLERWRWLSDRAPSRYVVVNIPGFRLYTFEDDSTAQHPVLAMNVIVGQAEGRHDTPVFTATMREVIFRPYWDVPPRIARTELIPLFRRRPEYFVSEGFEIVRLRTSDVPTETFPPTPQNVARVAAGTLRVRQRPGPSNALGFVKFIFPNPYNVFLHGTPTQELFATTRRDYSHGCIRVESPNDLAELVLRGQSPWDREAIDSVTEGDGTVHVPIARPLSVFVLYATAVADADGTVSFYPDLYKHDALLERALGLTPIASPR